MRSPAQRRQLALAIAALVCVANSTRAIAAQWYTEPSLALRAGREDNFLRTVNGDLAQNIYSVSPRIVLGSQTENSSVRANAYLTTYRYPGLEELDNTGAGADASLSYDYERFGYSLNGGIVRNVLLSYENIGVDASRTIDDTTSRTGSVTPSLRWFVTPRIQLSAASSYSDVEYSGGNASLYRDYRINAPSLTATYLFSEITQLYVTGTDQLIEYTNTAFPATSETRSGSVGINTQLSERFDLNASVGLRRTTSDTTQLTCVVFLGTFCAQTAQVTTSVLSEGRVYDANLTWRYENGTITGSATQNIAPSGQAASVLGTTFRAAISHAITPYLSAQFTVTDSRFRSDEGTAVLNNSVNYDFYRFEPGLAWRFAETWTARLTYGRSRYDYVTDTEPVIDDSVYLTLSWNPLRRYVSF